MPNNQHKVCAFCGKKGPFTREHVIPDFLYRKHPEQKFGYNPKADKFITWEAIIRDVCEACNNGPLSQLDRYGQVFYVDNKCERQYTTDKTLLINYDYNPLLRWLLKISFNAIRSAGGYSDLLLESIPFILEGESVPLHIYLFLEIVRSHRITEEDRKYLPEEAKNWDTLPAEMFRAGWIVIPSDVHFVGRYVAINSFYFHLFIFHKKTIRQMRRRVLRNFQGRVGTVAFLNKEKRQISLTVSTRTCLDAYTDQAAMLKENWEEYWQNQ